MIASSWSYLSTTAYSALVSLESRIATPGIPNSENEEVEV